MQRPVSCIVVIEVSENVEVEPNRKANIQAHRNSPSKQCPICRNIFLLEKRQITRKNVEIQIRKTQDDCKAET